MSDFYDSLEDECDENRCSSGSLDQYKTTTEDSVKRISDSELTDKYSFYLSRNVSDEGINVLPDSNFSKISPSSDENKNIFPEIGNGTGGKGLESFPSFVVDSHILSQQGLQLNNDGSFTKSPRLEVQELPFITREYRNLQFQKKKLYKTQRLPITKIQKKNIFSFSEKSADGISMNLIINARRKKESSEELLTSGGSSNAGRGKANKKFESNGNLTDSMKEKLLRSQRESPGKGFKAVSGIKKTKFDFNVTKNNGNSRRAKFDRQNNRYADADSNKTFLSSARFQQNVISLSNQTKKPTTTAPKISKYQSDILLISNRPKLNYSERRLLTNGYNPLHLRHWGKILSDTSRSNFGDSVAEELPEVSSLRLDSKNFDHVDEDEELFYQKLMEKDKNTKLQNHMSSRSECPLETEKQKGFKRMNSYKEQKETTTLKNLKSKPVSKSTSIDLTTDVDSSVNSLKKFSHYCSVDTSLNTSKVELALKAKTYGYLANARNIFRLKAQSERKSSSLSEHRNPNTEQSSSIKKVVDSSQDTVLQNRSNLLSQNRFPKINVQVPETGNKFSKVTNSLSKKQHFKMPEESREGFVLPQVNIPHTKHSQKQKQLLQQMSYCLTSPNG